MHELYLYLAHEQQFHRFQQIEADKIGSSSFMQTPSAYRYQA